MGTALWSVNGTVVGAGGGGGGDDDQTAEEVPFTPAGGIASSNVQTAIEELDSEKVPTARTVTAGAGLTGGGDLSANRTLDVGAGTGITVNANDVAVDTSVIATKAYADSGDAAVLAATVPTGRTVTAGAGLTGGGDLSANRTLDIGAGTGITVNANDIAVDTAVVATLTGTQTLTNKTLTSPAINFGSDARGDVIARGSSNYGRLARGAAGTAVVSDGTDSVYDFVTSVGKSATDTTYDGGVKLGSNAKETISTSTTLSATKTWHDVDTSGGALTPVLPSAAATDSLHTINDHTGSFATNPCTVDAESTNTINGSTSNIVLNRAWGTWTFRKLSATDWQLLGGSP